MFVFHVSFVYVQCACVSYLVCLNLACFCLFSVLCDQIVCAGFRMECVYVLGLVYCVYSALVLRGEFCLVYQKCGLCSIT